MPGCTIPLGRGMEYVEGKIDSSNSPCLGAALLIHLLDVEGSGAAEAEHYISFRDKGHVIPSLSPC